MRIRTSYPTPSLRPGSLTRERVGAAFGFAVFILIAVLVQERVLVGVDFAAARAKQAVVSSPLDVVAAAIGIAVSGEFSLAYAMIGCLLLWRAGLRRWALAPLAFLLSLPVEVVLKIVIAQSWVPSEFYRGVFYPLANLILQGTFPSGHAIRAAFLCTFLAVLLQARGG